MYVVINTTHVSETVLGPYLTAARASGAGFSRFGANVFGSPNRWRVKKVER